jgi:hypothetical protein
MKTSVLRLYIYGSGDWAARVVKILKGQSEIEIIAIVGSNKGSIQGYQAERFSKKRLLDRASDSSSCIYFCSHPDTQWRYFLLLLAGAKDGRLRAKIVLEKPIFLNLSIADRALELSLQALNLCDDLRMHSAFYWEALYWNQKECLGNDGASLHFRDGGNSKPHAFDSLLDWAIHSVTCVIDLFVIERGLTGLEFTLEAEEYGNYKISVASENDEICTVEVGELDERERSITCFAENIRPQVIDFLVQGDGTIPAVFLEPKSSRSVRSFLCGVLANQILLELRKKGVYQFSSDKYFKLGCSNW